MTPEDLNKLREALALIKHLNIVEGEKIAIHSAWKEQIEAVENAFLHRPTVITKEEWNILQGKTQEYDLLIFSNVFHYIDKPSVALTNVLNSCKYLLMQDLIIRNRGDNIFGDDGDSMRYRYKHLVSNYEGAFDLNKIDYISMFFIPYIDDGQHLHFITLIKGYL